MGRVEGKKTVGTDKRHQLEKQYGEQLTNGTEVKIKISLECNNFNELDFEEILSQYAMYSRKFYLDIAREVKNMPL